LVKKYHAWMVKVSVTKKLKFVNVKRDSLVLVVKNHSLNLNVKMILIVKKMLLIRLLLVIKENVNVRKEEKEKIAVVSKLVFV